MSKDSATHEGYDGVGIHENHSNMVKFRSMGDTGFKRLLGDLFRWEQEALPVPNSQQIVRKAVLKYRAFTLTLLIRLDR